MQFVVISAPTIIKSYSLRILSVILTRLFASAVCLLLQCTAGDGGGVHLSGWPGAGRDGARQRRRQGTHWLLIVVCYRLIDQNILGRVV